MLEDDQNRSRLERDWWFDEDLGDFSLSLILLLKKAIFLRCVAKLLSPRYPKKKKKIKKSLVSKT